MDQVQRAIYALADAAVALECLALALQVQRLPAERKRCCDWSVAENGAFLELWPHFTKPELAAIFGRTPGAIKSKAKQLKPGPKLPETDARATRCAARGNAGVFQPGHLPQTWVPIGTEIIDAYGYLKRKTRDGMQPAVYNFEFVHRLVWEQHHGPVPAGHKILFRNGDKSDIRIDNLECVSNADVMRRNTYHRYPEEIRQLIRTQAVLTRRINNRSKEL